MSPLYPYADFIDMLEKVLDCARGREGPAENEVISTAAGPAGGGTRGVRKRMVMARRVLGNIVIDYSVLLWCGLGV